MDVKVQDGFYILELPKAILVLTKEQFIDGLRRGKWWKRRGRPWRLGTRRCRPEQRCGVVAHDFLTEEDCQPNINIVLVRGELTDKGQVYARQVEQL